MTEGTRTAFLATLVVALPALALVAKLPSHPQILLVLNNAAHAPVFGALAIVLLLLLRRWRALAEWRRYATAFLVAVAIGALIEWIQPLFGRGAEWIDLRNDALGAIAGLALTASFRSRRWIFLLVAIAALAPVAWPVAEAALASAARARQFPTILGFNSPCSLYYISSRGVDLALSPLPEMWRQANDPLSLQIRVIGGQWPGLTHEEPQPDWRGYSRLMLDLTNPDTRPLTLTVRVHDRAHNNQSSDRFNRTFTIPGAKRQTVSFALAEIGRAPLERTLDLSRVAGLILFGDEDPASSGREYYVTRVWLE